MDGNELQNRARELGFAAIGFSRPATPLFFDEFRAWLRAGKHGDMAWLARNLDIRKDPRRLLKECQTIISLAYPYSAQQPGTPEGLTTARYTEPQKTDYHPRLRRLAKQFAESIHHKDPQARSRVCVDSAPILERSFAYSAGIGFFGKNNMLIVPGHGSYLFLVEILTTALIQYQEISPLKSRCGSCARCVDACPTGALRAPYSLNASRCLSYLTIECKKKISPETAKRMGRCFLGCDICQEVCPFNKAASSAQDRLPGRNEFLRMDTATFDERFGKTALARAGHEKIKGNLKAVLKHLETKLLEDI
jgi:epoxyqueuosine reductase